jgi:Flp pilus assembly protein TadD
MTVEADLAPTAQPVAQAQPVAATAGVDRTTILWGVGAVVALAIVGVVVYLAWPNDKSNPTDPYPDLVHGGGRPDSGTSGGGTSGATGTEAGADDLSFPDPDTRSTPEPTPIAITASPGTPAEFNQRGMAKYNEKKYAEAEVLFRKAVSGSDSSHTVYQNNLAKALYCQKKWEEMYNVCQEILSVDPKNAYYQDNFGQACFRTRRFSMAVSSYREALGVDPKRAETHNRLGVALARQEKRGEADACYRKAVSLDPTIAVFHENLGFNLVIMDKPAEGESALRQAVKLKPRVADSWGKLSRAQSKQKKYAEAETSLRKAIELDPNNADRHNEYGHLYHSQKLYTKAAGEYRQAIKIGSKFTPNYYANLAGSLFRAGRRTEAEEEAQEALRLGYKGDHWVFDALKKSSPKKSTSPEKVYKK